jgi:pyruvyltransferase
MTIPPLLNSDALYVYWWKRIPNIGDALSPRLIETMSGRAPQWSASKARRVFTGIGSVVQYAKPNWIIWGSGCICPDRPITMGLTVLAVRGPKTAELLVKAGYADPVPFGDPALLAPLLLEQRPPRRIWEWGIIPHYIDYPWVCWLLAKDRCRSLFGRSGSSFSNEKACIINPLLAPDDFLRRLLQCRNIVSSSLHGLILADAFGIPNVWFATQRNPIKALALKVSRFVHDHFKFFDYFESMARAETSPVWVEGAMPWDELSSRLETWRPPSWDPVPLLSKFPFAPRNFDRFIEKAQDYFKAMKASSRFSS